MIRRPPRSTLFSLHDALPIWGAVAKLIKGKLVDLDEAIMKQGFMADRKSTRLNSSHSSISYAVFCLKIFFFNDTATTEIYALFPTRRSSDLGCSGKVN